MITKEREKYMKHFYHTIQGWFDFPDLYSEMVLKHNDAKFVEVGVWKGKSLSNPLTPCK